VVAISIGVAVSTAGAVVALVAPTVLGVLVLIALVQRLITWADGPERERLLHWTLWSFFGHLLFGLVVINVPTATRYLAADSATYHAIAQSILRHWTAGFPMPQLGGGKEAYYYLLAGIYWVFGAHPAAGLAVNALLAAALVPVTTDLTHELFGERPARYAAPLVVLFPSIFIWTSQLLKEALILFLIVTAADGAAHLARRVSFWATVAMGLSVSLLFAARGFVGAAVAVALVVGIILGSGQWVRGLNTSVVALAVLAVFVLAVGVGYSGYHFITDTNLEFANNARLDLARTGATGFQQTADISTTRRALAFLPVGIVSVGAGPFPWKLSGARQLPALLDVLVWWALLLSLARGLAVGWRTVGRRIAVLVLPAVSVLIPLALIIGNYGTVIRERTQVVVLVVPLIALGLAARKDREAEELEIPDRPLAALATGRREPTGVP
jgi:4-amino-4-deoxy-L-arabinose transferase-like glycosyltransferase